MPPIAEELATRSRSDAQQRVPQAIRHSRGPVLVVGGGNSGFQIAEDSPARTKFTRRSARGKRRYPSACLAAICSGTSRHGPDPQDADSRIGQRLSGRDTLIGSTLPAVRRGGRAPSASIAAEGSTVTFADRTKLESAPSSGPPAFGAITRGSTRQFDEGGAPMHRRGVTSRPASISSA